MLQVQNQGEIIFLGKWYGGGAEASKGQKTWWNCSVLRRRNFLFILMAPRWQIEHAVTAALHQIERVLSRPGDEPGGALRSHYRPVAQVLLQKGPQQGTERYTFHTLFQKVFLEWIWGEHGKFTSKFCILRCNKFVFKFARKFCSTRGGS